jgi:hypothetical protein
MRDSSGLPFPERGDERHQDEAGAESNQQPGAEVAPQAESDAVPHIAAAVTAVTRFLTPWSVRY